MLRLASLLLVILLAGCSRPVAPAAGRPTAPAAERQASEVRLPSRARDTDARGFYAEPAGLSWDFAAAGPDQIRRGFETARAAGAGYLRFTLGWDSAGPDPGRYDWRLWDQVFQAARETGVVPLPCVSSTPKRLNAGDAKRFGEFMEALSRRYAAPSWELWDEPDSAGSQEELAALVRSGADGVRRGDPRARVVLGGMWKGRTPFPEQTLRAAADVIDVVDVHGGAGDAEESAQSLGEVADAVRKLAPRADLWLTASGQGGGEPDVPAVAFWRAQALALGSGRFSLTTWSIDASGARTPAFSALALWNRLLSGPVRPVEAGSDGAVVRAFEKPSGERVVIAWPASGPNDAVVSIDMGRPEDRAEIYDLTTGEIAGERRLASVRLRADSVLVGLVR